MKTPHSRRLGILALIAIALMLFHTASLAIGPNYSGSWYNPEQDGHGFSLEYSELNDGTPVVVAYWYVYDIEGNQIYLIGSGEPEEGDTVTLQFTATHGMKFGEFDPEQTVREDGGTGVFSFENSKTGVFDYLPSEWMVQTYGVSAISIPVVQLLEVAHPESDEPPLEGSYVDTYVGSWTGRMIYDRRSTGMCYDADVQILVAENKSWAGHSWEFKSITVIRDIGGLDSYNGQILITHSGLVGDAFGAFDETIDMNMQFPPVDSYELAEGFWNYRNLDCYGEWAFAKD